MASYYTQVECYIFVKNYQFSLSFTSCAPNQDQKCINNKQGHFLNFDFWTTEVSHSLCLISLQSTSGLCGVRACVLSHFSALYTSLACKCLPDCCEMCVPECVCLSATYYIIIMAWRSHRHPITNRADDKTRHGRGLKIGNVSKSRVLT